MPANRKLECPKHEDKTASLHLYEDSWYCFSCGLHGDGIGLVALFTNQDVRRLLSQRGDRKPDRHATKGLTKTQVGREAVARRRDVYNWWWQEIADAYRESKEWALLRAVDVWTDVFDELTDRITGTGLYDGDKALSPHDAEQAIEDLRRRLVAALPLEIEEGRRTKE